ncbi:MAG: hypothetical protein LBO64_02460 [Desulfovibrio sp.]|jgi:GT2 family glycosyltransferase|nr:hypothetical protein [Desulfovibrio sp.]
MKAETTLYDIILPPEDAEPETHDLYLRSRGEVLVDSAAALHMRGSDDSAAWAAFDTYVNAFAQDRWKTYTRLGTVALKVRLRGSCRISLYAVDAHNRESLTASHQVEARTEAQEFVLPFPDTDAVLLTWSLAGEDCALFSASYVTEVPVEFVNPVRLGVVICTFRRERNARALMAALARSVDAGACAEDDLRVFLVDNGRTMDDSVCVRPWMKLVPNRNAGGSGGFARGMLEVLDNTGFQATHLLLMDDDIELPDGALQKTFSLLRLLRPEYASACIGGAMFDLRQKYMHYASVETTSGIFFAHRTFGDIDVRCREDFLPLAMDGRCPRQYQAWWYCVYPSDIPARYGLPYPFFFQQDDIEYFIRSELKYVIHLNGIFVWHESFHLKETNAKNVYTYKNFLIFTALRPSMRLPIYARIARDMLFSILSFNYKNFMALRMAANIFLEGPEQMRRENIYEELLEKAKLCDDELVDLSEYARFRTTDTDQPKLSSWRKAVMALTLNGHFLPDFCLGECAWVSRNRQLGAIFLKKTLCHAADSSGYGTVRRISIKALFREIRLLVPVLAGLVRRKAAVGKRYRDMYAEMTSAEWAREHLSAD